MPSDATQPILFTGFSADSDVLRLGNLNAIVRVFQAYARAEIKRGEHDKIELTSGGLIITMRNESAAT